MMGPLPELLFAPLNTPEPAFAVRTERRCDAAARERLLDAAMGAGRRRKSSETLRRGRHPASGLSFVASDDSGRIVGTVRLWHVHAGAGQDCLPVPALLLGPLAVCPSLKGIGIGTLLVKAALREAARLGHPAVLLVGDPGYYARFGFSAGLTRRLSMPGPYEVERFLAVELHEGHLSGVSGVLSAAGTPRFHSAGRTSHP